MSLNRLHVVLAATVLAFAAGWLSAPTGAQSQVSPIPCRVSWDYTTHGGDWFHVQGEAMLSQIAPQADGSFVAIGYGPGKVTYHPGNAACTITSGEWFEASYMVTLESADGLNAQVDISSLDAPHSFDILCPGRIQGRGSLSVANASTLEYDPPELPTVNVDLHKGVAAFENDQAIRTAAGLQRVGDKGTVTLHYCPPAQPNGR
jgi:hypothetical protein